MTQIEESNKKQLKKFCPMIKDKCRFDCNWFRRAKLPYCNHWESTSFLNAKCTFKS